jgi:hypothetical protein
VSGQILLHDPQAPGATLPNLEVGLAYPDQPEVEAQPGVRTPERMTWQNDAKHYEFWTRGTADGRFTIPNVRPGTYELHAIADGVLGEYAKADITIGSGGKVDLGKLEWVPVRYGKQLWQIGIPNRSASEFLNGNDHWHWGEYIQYAKLFPNDVNFTIGKSDFHKDWFIYQVPHDLDPNDTTGRGQGRADPMEGQLRPRRSPRQRRSRRSAAGAGGRRREVHRRDGQRTGRRYGHRPRLQRDHQPRRRAGLLGRERPDLRWLSAPRGHEYTHAHRSGGRTHQRHRV